MDAKPADQQQQEGAGQGPNSEALAAAVQAATASFAKRNRGNRGNLRKRPADEEGQQQQTDNVTAAEDDDPTVVQRKAKAIRGEPLAFTNKTDNKESVHVAFESSRTIQSGKDESVFKVLETETETDRDARALREAVLKQQAEGAKDDGVYKGMNNYIDYRAGFRREHTVASEKGTGSHGPLRANMYVRMTALMDYNPCLCKDYKETGYCSYGDSCKFLHDRGDYKMSWELDRDWEEEQKRKLDEKMRKLERGDDEEEEAGEQDAREAAEAELPFACYICRKHWGEAKNPVVTRCKHYFCESCALKHNAKTSKCAACDQPTQGVFNTAHDIIKKMKKQQQQGR